MGDGHLADGITHNNKDVLFKVLSQLYKDKSLSVYGLDIPRIKRMIPTGYPAVVSNEYRGDNAFLLVDDSLYIQEYESHASGKDDFIKYNNYVCRALQQLWAEGVDVKRVIIGVIYTGDISEASPEWDMGALRVQVKQVFLSRFDTDSMYADLKSKIEKEEALSDEDVLRLIVLPLTQPDKTRKQRLIEDSVELAKRLHDEKLQLFVVAGILTATDKFVDRSYSDQIKEWIKMTKVARLFEEEKIEAINETRREERFNIAKNLLQYGMDRLDVMKLTGLTRSEVEQVRESLINAA